ncbi:hypothetical protein G4B88_009416 [Cannabis sativa]|uniref:Glutathione S-transferase n=1 Tax=Cannabis sativa TaxID=3483 RepID=A0A7J6GGN8_CANSA|nr:hypothetical protein G4B88_009416 [Cannabis sativa]
MEDKVVLLDFWPSSYAMRVKIALAEKDIQYEVKEENLSNKSSLLLEMNTVHNMILVLIHNGKPNCESLKIVYYIDQIYSLGKRVWKSKGDEQEAVKKEFIENLKILEG